MVAADPAAAAAQEPDRGVVVGTVVSESGESLAAANVTVRSAADSTVVGGTLSTRAGRFRVGDIPPGRYFVEVVYVGYSAARSELIELAAGETLALEPLRLAVDAVELEGIDVRTDRAPAAFAADRSIYSTADMPAVAGGGATEALRAVPELEVDIDGEVTLDGATPEIHINGRPVPMDGEALAVFLEQFPSERIERIEVIPNPSARYAAEGDGGIVNIVLREEVDLGLSGSVFGSAGSRGRSSGGGQVAYQRGALTLFSGGFVRHEDRETTSFDLRQNLVAEPTTFLRQDARSQRDGLSGSVDLTARYELAPGTLLWTESRVFARSRRDDALRTTTHMDARQDPTLRYDRASRADRSRFSGDMGVGLRRDWEPRRHRLELELDMDTGSQTSGERVETSLEHAPDPGADLPPELLLDDAERRDRRVTFQADYLRPVGDGALEVGYRGRLDDRRQDRARRLVDGAGDAVDDRGYEHRRRFNSAYATLSAPVAGMSVQVGLRAEHAASRFETPAAGRLERDDLTLFPSANLSYDVGGGAQLRASYSHRVRRPHARILDPTDRSSDPLNRRVGNPDIEPQYSHSVRLDARYSGTLGTLRVAPFYRRTEGDWERIQTVDGAGVSTTTWENLASSETWGARFTASLRETRGWSGYASVRAQREVRDAANLATDYSGAGLRWSTRANVSARVLDDLAVQTMVSWTPAREVAQGRVGSRLMTHVGIRQRLLDGRASVRVALVDPLDLYEQSFETRDPTHLQVGRSDRSVRSARISFSYAFGPDGDRLRRADRGGDPDETGEGDLRD